jgi:hypothetical protein
MHGIVHCQDLSVFLSLHSAVYLVILQHTKVDGSVISRYLASALFRCGARFGFTHRRWKGEVLIVKLGFRSLDSGRYFIKHVECVDDGTLETFLFVITQTWVLLKSWL